MVCAFLALSFATAPAVAQENSARLTDLSLDQLGDLVVTSVAKEPEKVGDTPVAIFVITQEDIRRSGYTSIPEVLRLAPGVEVARIDSDHWSIGIRGLGDTFSKSLLVLIDGRSLYTPLFAGTYWPAQDVLLEDVDRIEVIRGPGGTIWGADAVTGVINIITRNAAQTHGLLATVTTGSVDRALEGLRYGGGNGKTFDYRAYIKGTDRREEFHSDNVPFDRWWMSQGGARADWKPRAEDTVTVQGDVSTGRHGESVQEPTFTPPGVTVLNGALDAQGANVQARWDRQGSGGSSTHLQAYYDWTSWNAPHFEEQRHTVDVDFVNSPAALGRHALTWGAGARWSPDALTQKIPSLTFNPLDETERVYSAFGQDVITLRRDRVAATVGSKIEHNNYTGVEVEPSARLLWTPGHRQTIWTSLSRGVRTPSRIERSVDSTSLFTAGPPFPIFLVAEGSATFTAEKLIGFEIGYRAPIAPKLFLDLATFRNVHHDLQTFGTAVISVAMLPAPAHVLATVPYTNGADGTSAGFEVSPEWHPISWWQLRGYYSYVSFDIRTRPGTIDANAIARYEGSSPKNEGRIESHVSVAHGAEFDVVYRAVSALPARSVAAYQTADARLAWSASRVVSLALNGENLLQPHHVEWGPDPVIPVAISRAVSLTLAINAGAHR